MNTLFFYLILSAALTKRSSARMALRAMKQRMAAQVLIGFALMDECRQQDVPREVYQNSHQTELGLKGTLLIYKYGVKAEGRGECLDNKKGPRQPEHQSQDGCHQQEQGLLALYHTRLIVVFLLLLTGRVTPVYLVLHKLLSSQQ